LKVLVVLLEDEAGLRALTKTLEARPRRPLGAFSTTRATSCANRARLARTGPPDALRLHRERVPGVLGHEVAPAASGDVLGLVCRESIGSWPLPARNAQVPMR
jgi:hypothetical protein